MYYIRQASVFFAYACISCLCRSYWPKDDRCPKICCRQSLILHSRLICWCRKWSKIQALGTSEHGYFQSGPAQHPRHPVTTFFFFGGKPYGRTVQGKTLPTWRCFLSPKSIHSIPFHPHHSHELLMYLYIYIYIYTYFYTDIEVWSIYFTYVCIEVSWNEVPLNHHQSSILFSDVQA